MPKKKKSDKDSKTKLIVRIEATLRDNFIEVCRDLDTSASREVRRFIRDFLDKNSHSSDDPQSQGSGGSAKS